MIDRVTKLIQQITEILDNISNVLSLLNKQAKEQNEKIRELEKRLAKLEEKTMIKQKFRIKVYRISNEKYKWEAYVYGSVSKEILSQPIRDGVSYSEETAEKEARECLERLVQEIRDLENAKYIEVEI